jgi:hypothetical protein
MPCLRKVGRRPDVGTGGDAHPKDESRPRIVELSEGEILGLEDRESPVLSSVGREGGSFEPIGGVLARRADGVDH